MEFRKTPKGLRTFICTCSPEGQAEAYALMSEVRERMAGGSEELTSRKIDDSNFITCIVQSLHWDYGVNIRDIGCDQWTGVAAERYSDRFRVWAECDRVEDGFAAVWLAFADHVPPVKEPSDETEVEPRAE